MNHEFQQYRLARIEGHNITRARLQSQFANGIGDPGEFGKAIAEQLAMPPGRLPGGASPKWSKPVAGRESAWPHLSFTGNIGKKYGLLLLLRFAWFDLSFQKDAQT